mgnify:CR=1 FL=1
MIVLPIDTCEMFWRAFAGEVLPAELEQWIYAHDAELEALLPNDVYLDLIALDFADKWALHEIEKLVGAYVQRDSQAYQRYEDGAPVREVRQYLRRLAAQPDDTLAFENLLDYTQHFPFLYDLTNELQDWFADGYRTPLPPQKQAQIRALAQGLLDDIAAGRIVFAFTTQGVLFCLDNRPPEKDRQPENGKNTFSGCLKRLFKRC